jgi:hypothetical protein
VRSLISLVVVTRSEGVRKTRGVDGLLRHGYLCLSSRPVTIIASVKVRDGLILGTDSMTQIAAPMPQGGVTVLKSYSNARKLFQVADIPIGVMTYGLGNVGNRSIEGLVLDFSRNAEPASVESISRGLFDYVKEQYDSVFEGVADEQRPVLGFYVAGYTQGEPLADEFEFLLPRDAEPFRARDTELFGASWRGVDAPFTRLYKGFDAYVIPPRLEEKGLNEEDIAAVLEPEGLETQVLFDGMPVQDAINFAVYILDTTISWTTFQLGAPACGRPLQVATILADTGFAWVAKPELTVQA